MAFLFVRRHFAKIPGSIGGAAGGGRVGKYEGMNESEARGPDGILRHSESLVGLKSH